MRALSGASIGPNAVLGHGTRRTRSSSAPRCTDRRERHRRFGRDHRARRGRRAGLRRSTGDVPAHAIVAGAAGANRRLRGHARRCRPSRRQLDPPRIDVADADRRAGSAAASADVRPRPAGKPRGARVRRTPVRPAARVHRLRRPERVGSRRPRPPDVRAAARLRRRGGQLRCRRRHRRDRSFASRPRLSASTSRRSSGACSTATRGTPSCSSSRSFPTIPDDYVRDYEEFLELVAGPAAGPRSRRSRADSGRGPTAQCRRVPRGARRRVRPRARRRALRAGPRARRASRRSWPATSAPALRRGRVRDGRARASRCAPSAALPGDEIVTAANAGFYASTAARAAGLRSRYADVDAGDADALRRDGRARADAGGRTRVVVTHLYGLLADVEAIVELCRGRGVARRRGLRAGGRRASAGDGTRARSATWPRSASTRRRTSARSATAARSSRRRRRRRARASAAAVRLGDEVPRGDARRPQLPARRAPGRDPAGPAAAPRRVERAPPVIARRYADALPRACRAARPRRGRGRTSRTSPSPLVDDRDAVRAQLDAAGRRHRRPLPDPGSPPARLGRRASRTSACR